MVLRDCGLGLVCCLCVLCVCGTTPVLMFVVASKHQIRKYERRIFNNISDYVSLNIPLPVYKTPYS